MKPVAGKGGRSVRFTEPHERRPFFQTNNQKIKGSHNNAGKANTATIVPTSTKPSSLGLDNHSHCLTSRGTVRSSIESEGAWCKRQTATRKLATLHNARVHMNVHHAAKAPSGTVNHGLVPRIARNVVRAVIAAQ